MVFIPAMNSGNFRSYHGNLASTKGSGYINACFRAKQAGSGPMFAAFDWYCWVEFSIVWWSHRTPKKVLYIGKPCISEKSRLVKQLIQRLNVHLKKFHKSLQINTLKARLWCFCLPPTAPTETLFTIIFTAEFSTRCFAYGIYMFAWFNTVARP